ncbi:glycine cleavage system protein H [Desulfospira joergensenii]|uniref:glycine cleavage system protein H n=1 Tax=Desulfospira joergensenii TaxID=53329 RepID=UPI0003B585AD|nr:glycine cleavage system protein H [Desulfospira joergensenii]
MKLSKAKKSVKGFRVVEDQCIWMKAGIVNFRLCDNVYDCQNCPFDKGMQKSMSRVSPGVREKEPSKWADQLRKNYRGSSRPCRHALTGRVDAPKICTLNYECFHCSFDQMLDEMDTAELSSPPGYDRASGFRLARGYYYHMGHSWARFEHGGRIRAGFDDFMVRLFGAITYLSLPPLGASLKKDQICLTFGRGDKRAAVLSPITGTVLAVNHKAREHPEITHEDPFHQGWLYIIEPEMPKRNLKGLFYGRKSLQWTDQESQKLLKLMGPEYENLAATGGEPVRDVAGAFPEIGWDVLTRTFLGTEKSEMEPKTDRTMPAKGKRTPIKVF